MGDSIQEFLQKLSPCIEQGNLETCVNKAAWIAQEMEISAEDILALSIEESKIGKYEFAYVLSLAAAQSLEDTKKAGAYHNAGFAVRFIGDFEASEKFYKIAIKLNPKFAAAYNNYANLLQYLERKDEAEIQYKKAIEFDPKSAIAHYNYANLLQDLNRKEEAEEHYITAIESDPKYADAHYNYANLLQNSDWKEEAEEHYKKAIE